ncbi:MAG: archaellin/type IV pilin N-terminal domain-containing protein [Dehalococcoidia bacterium]
MLKRLFKRTHASQKGITGLETAIILIAFVVVAAVFAYTVLSAGLFSSQKSSEAVYAGLQETQSTLEIKGSVIGFQDPAETTDLGWVKFTLANAIGGAPINFTQPTDLVGMAAPASTNVIVISVATKNERKDDITWSYTQLGNGDGDALLEPGERFEITCTSSTGGSMFSDILSTDLDASDTFTLEVKPPAGAPLIIERTLPDYVDAVMDLN